MAPRSLLIAAIAVGSGLAPTALGQLETQHVPSAADRDFTFRQFIDAVSQSNLDLAAQRYSVSIAKAQLIAARVSPNPTLDLGGARDITGQRQPASENVGVSQVIELGGKRRFRVSAATQNLLAVSATVEDFFRTLRGTAGNAFVDAVAGEMIVAQKRKAFESLNRLADLNRVRFREGDIADVDYNQAVVDSLRAQGDVIAAQATAQNNLLALTQLVGAPPGTWVHPTSELKISSRRFDLRSLLATAREKRADILAARNSHAAAVQSARLAKANRIPDPSLSASLQQTESGRNAINPSPNFNSVSFGVSFPIPLFNSLRGEALGAAQTALQAQKNIEALQLKAEVEVRQSFARYELAKQRAAQYQGEISDLSSKVLDARLAAYKTGGASLLDVLNAQKADTDVRLAAIDALSERAKALIALEQAAGIWDLDL